MPEHLEALAPFVFYFWLPAAAPICKRCRILLKIRKTPRVRALSLESGSNKCHLHVASLQDGVVADLGQSF